MSNTQTATIVYKRHVNTTQQVYEAPSTPTSRAGKQMHTTGAE